MTITYYFRDQREGNYSIEKVFSAISAKVEEEHKVQFFYVDSNRSRFHNLKEAAKVQGDVNHITGDVNWLAFSLDPSRTVLTVHDIGHYENTLQGLHKIAYRYFWMDVPYKRAHSITCISEFTKSRLCHFFPGHEAKTAVIHNPQLSSVSNRDENTVSEIPRIVQVGSMKNKNLTSLIEAVEGIDCTLVLLRNPDDSLKQVLNSKGISYEFHHRISDKKVDNLLQTADILYFASTYEGFGLPILEAQAVGLPVLTSITGSMPEVAGEGACYVDPNNIDMIKQGIIRLIHDTNFRYQVVSKGYTNLSRFQLDNIVAQYLDVYKAIA